MIEVKVAAKEVVKLSFGGQHGWPLEEFVMSAETIKGRDALAARADGLMKKLEERKCGPHCFSTITKLKEELLEAKRRMEIKLVWPTAENIAALMNEHLGRRLAHEWKLIETAPKDGRAYLFVDEIVDRAHRAQIGFWRGDGLWLSEAGRVMHPTHWMPLPEPPK